MILVFGGTTEGKKVAEILDFIEEPYFYSTKTEVRNHLLKGTCLSGGMDCDQIHTFCQEKEIRLLIDAAHPFAVQLHENIHQTAQQLAIPVLRFERIYDTLEEKDNIRLFDSYQVVTTHILNNNFQKILALTGVQTIPSLKNLWTKRTCYFRILNTELSKEKADLSGICKDWIIPMNPSNDPEELVKLVQKTEAEILLSKESGASGFMKTKIEVSQRLNIPLWVVKRPVLPNFDFIVNSEKQLLQQIYLLRKNVLKKGNKLRSGFTTGTCATASAKACLIAIIEGKFPKSVTVSLPDGEETGYLIFPQFIKDKAAACTVIKDGGDDPDVTHGKEIGCKLKISDEPGFHFFQGKGVGKVTLPGLQIAVGEPAINPVPRKMICDNLEKLAAEFGLEMAFDVTPFVPEGEKLALQTFNPRVGVIGGISIVGTSGRVVPYSNEAFLDTIKYQLSIVYQSDCDEILLTSGKRSENELRPSFPHLPDMAFIHIGNLVDGSLKMAVDKQIKKINLALRFGKAIKLAEGNFDTHSKNIRFNPYFLAELARSLSYPEEITQQLEKLTLANAALDILPLATNQKLYRKVASACFQNCMQFIPEGVSFSFILPLDEEYIRINAKS